jgi:hypothetical protein
MLLFKNPDIYGYVEARLDAEKRAYTFEGNALEISAVGLDNISVSPPILNVSLSYINIGTRDRGGPVIMQIITGDDLAEILEAGTTIDAIETVLLRTGIENPLIPPEELMKAEVNPVQHMIESLRKFAAERRELNESLVKRTLPS